MTEAAGEPFRSFSLHEGGPFYRLMTRLHMIHASGRIRGMWLALLVWTPLAIGAVLRAVLGMRPDPTLLDLSVHVRLLVALPVMLVSERLVEPACRSAINSLYVGGFCERASLDHLVEQGEQLRDAWWPEAALLALALLGGQLAFWNVSGPTGVFHGETGVSAWSFPHVWYVMTALPLTQFVMLRWLWRWGIWAHMLARIARVPIAAVPTHPDRATGLACLARPVSGFGGFAFAAGAILASAWGTQLLAQHTTVKALVPALFVFLAAILAVAVAPLLLFCGHLYRVRRRGLAQYGDFATEYSRGFHARWIDSQATGERALGSPDIQSLSDLGNAFSVISSTRLFVFGMRPILAVWAAALVPMIPLFASMISVEHLLQRVVRTVLGGVPL